MQTTDFIILDYDFDQLVEGEVYGLLDRVKDEYSYLINGTAIIRTDNGVHVYLYLYHPIKFDDALLLMEVAGCDKKYIDLVRRKRKFFDKKEVMRKMRGGDL